MVAPLPTQGPRSVAAHSASEARSQVTRPEIEQRLTELAAEIEQAQTRVWLAENEREQLRFELRRLINAESKAAA
jgi:hypothetical protein